MEESLVMVGWPQSTSIYHVLIMVLLNNTSKHPGICQKLETQSLGYGKSMVCRLENDQMVGFGGFSTSMFAYRRVIPIAYMYKNV